MGTAITLHEQETALGIRPELDVEYTTRQVLARVAIVGQVKTKLMKEGIHFGKPPGVGSNAKPVLLKPGAETLLMAFNVAPDYRCEDLSVGDEVVRYRFCAAGKDASGRIVGQGLGEASSDEEKYRWRRAARKEFDATPEERRRVKHRAGWDGKPDTQEMQVRTYPPDIANTVLKMAAKRALVHLAITVTACSDMFDQDLEDLDASLVQMGYEDEAQDPEPRPVAPAEKPPVPTLEGIILPAGEEGARIVMKAAGKAMPLGMSEADWRVEIKNRMRSLYGVESAKLLKKHEAEEFISKLEKMAVAKVTPPNENPDAEPAT